MPEKIAEIICPHCNSKIVAYRDSTGRVLIASGLGIVLAFVGGIIGASIGIATGGWGIPATVPLAIFGFVVGSGTGYIIGDKAVDMPKCPKCGKEIELGL